MTRARNSKGHFVKKVAKVLTESEKESIIDQKSELEATLREKKEYGAGTAASQIDEGKIKGEIAYLDRVLHEGSPRVKSNDKDNLIREGMRLAEKLQEGLPTKDEMRFPAKNPGAVRKHLRWDYHNRDMIQRYNTILRTLGPDHPLQSIEQMRKEK